MNAFGRRLAIFSLFYIFLFSSTALATTVLAIDYGSDYIKASLIKPGTPFDVLLDKDSKRKIRSSVAWKNGERLFGQDAFNLVRASLLFFGGRRPEWVSIFAGDTLPEGLIQLAQVPPRHARELGHHTLLHQFRASRGCAVNALYCGRSQRQQFGF